MTFRTRLDAAIADMGGLVAPPGPMQLAYDDAEAGKRFTWGGTSGLAGTLTCSAANSFEDFTIALPEAVRASDGLPLALGRLTEMAGASVCALAVAGPDACRALARTMVQESLAQFQDSLARREDVPTGSRDYRVVEGVDAELDLTPLAITWSIGPGRAATTGATRRGLSAKNLDE